MLRAFTVPVLRTLLFTELQDPHALFALPAGYRACLKSTMAPLLDPHQDLAAARAALVQLLTVENFCLNRTAAHVLAVHAYHNFAASAPVLGSLYETLDARGRFWLLVSFSVILPDTPPAWGPFLEVLTRRLLADHPEVFYADTLGLLHYLDLVLVPLGLAYGKAGMGMPYFAELIRESVESPDALRMTRILQALAPVGLYYPHAVLQLLRATIPDLGDPVLAPGLVALLGLMRTLHLDVVDGFLQQVGLDAAREHEIAAAADSAQVHRYIQWLGIYSTIVNQCARFPELRRRFSMRFLEVLADAGSWDSLVGNYTRDFMRMLQESEYRLGDWLVET